MAIKHYMRSTSKQFTIVDENKKGKHCRKCINCEAEKDQCPCHANEKVRLA